MQNHVGHFNANCFWVKTKENEKKKLYRRQLRRYYTYYIAARRKHQQTTHIFYNRITDKPTNYWASGLVGLSYVHARRLNVFELITHVRRIAKTFLKNITYYYD